MADLYKNYDAVNFDGLISDTVPQIVTGAGTIAKGAAEATYVRGTVFAKSSSTGKLVILGTSAGSGETLTAYGILCDDITVGTAADAGAAIYVAGTFDPGKLTVADGYTMTAADVDALRDGGIYLKAAQA